MGYVPGNKGKTSGSRVIFKGDGLKPIMLHKPHPGNIVKGYVMKQVYDYLRGCFIISVKAQVGVFLFKLFIKKREHSGGYETDE